MTAFTYSLSSIICIDTQFNELSKGKDYIPEKRLRKWDELKELIEADLVTEEILESYFSRLDIVDGKVDFRVFQQFIGMLDMVLVDDEGTLLGLDDQDRAVDLDLDEE
jgi:hypothetical protein